MYTKIQLFSKVDVRQGSGERKVGQLATSTKLFKGTWLLQILDTKMADWAEEGGGKQPFIRPTNTSVDTDISEGEESDAESYWKFRSYFTYEEWLEIREKTKEIRNCEDGVSSGKGKTGGSEGFGRKKRVGPKKKGSGFGSKYRIGLSGGGKKVAKSKPSNGGNK